MVTVSAQSYPELTANPNKEFNSMQKLILISTVAIFAFSLSAPVRAAVPVDAGLHSDGGQMEIEKRKKPRVKGGSGCDDAGDLAEHSSCR